MDIVIKKLRPFKIDPDIVRWTVTLHALECLFKRLPSMPMNVHGGTSILDQCSSIDIHNVTSFNKIINSIFTQIQGNIPQDIILNYFELIHLYPLLERQFFYSPKFFDKIFRTTLFDFSITNEVLRRHKKFNLNQIIFFITSGDDVQSIDIPVLKNHVVNSEFRVFISSTIDRHLFSQLCDLNIDLLVDINFFLENIDYYSSNNNKGIRSIELIGDLTGKNQDLVDSILNSEQYQLIFRKITKISDEDCSNKTYMHNFFTKLKGKT
ncbi:MAG: hypothetical protein HQK52_00960 [Oligoflexia bacterium]|nr:hypothetical protein [Oligoflexia bacterium]